MPRKLTKAEKRRRMKGARILEVDRIVGRNLKMLRRDSGLRLCDLGDAIGVAFQQIQKYEAGQNRISAGRLWTLAGVLGCPVRDFFNGLPRGEGQK